MNKLNINIIEEQIKDACQCLTDDKSDKKFGCNYQLNSCETVTSDIMFDHTISGKNINLYSKLNVSLHR